MNAYRPGIVLLGLTLVAPSTGQTTIRASVDSSGNQANDSSWTPLAISADGSTVAFHSPANNLVPGDTSPTYFFDVFVRDLAGGVTTRASVAMNGEQPDGSSAHASLSSDGRYVAFNSTAGNLVPGDTNFASDVFVRDLVSGTTTRVSVDSSGAEGDAASFAPSISGDGRFVAFISFATNLVASDGNAARDVFVHDRSLGTTTRVSVDSAGIEADDGSYDPYISADGRHVAFHSYATNLVPNDTNGFHDVFVHEIQTGVTERVSVGASGQQLDEKSWSGSLSADGRLVSFTSTASNVVPGDVNGARDAFVKDRSTGAVTLVSVDSLGAQADLGATSVFLSANGEAVAFESHATNLVPDDTNAALDVFVHDLVSRTTMRASVGSGGSQADDLSFEPCLSADGRLVAFQSWAENLVPDDTNGEWDVFVCDLDGSGLGTVHCTSAPNSTGQRSRIHAGGSSAVADNDLYLRCDRLPPGASGYFLCSRSPGFVPQPGGSAGTLCLGSPIGRFAAHITQSSPAGVIELQVPDLLAMPLLGPAAPGETWYFQVWHRDLGPSSNMSDGIAIPLD